MSRKANTSLVLDVTVDQVHECDVLVGRGGNDVLFYVEAYKRMNLRRQVTTVNLDTRERSTYTMDMNHLVRVRAEHECDCNGSGVYIWGPIVNGTPTHAGEHFACHGKGYQDRSDVIRNRVYWDRYARV